MRKLSLSCAFILAVTIPHKAATQELDGAVGFGTVTAPAASTNSNGISVPSLSGGLYPSFSGILRLKNHIGAGAEVAWRASGTLYGINEIPYRPLFFDFNAVYGGTRKKVGGDVMAGIGIQDVRFYRSFVLCGAFTGCTNYNSDKHVAFHVAGDIRYYFWGHAFIRPEAHYYVVHNNFEFNKVNVARFAVSIGYSFLPGF